MRLAGHAGRATINEVSKSVPSPERDLLHDQTLEGLLGEPPKNPPPLQPPTLEATAHTFRA